MWVCLKSEELHCSVRVWQRVEEWPCACNVILRGLRETILAVEEEKVLYVLSVCL